MNAVLEPKEPQPIEAYDEFRAQLAELREWNATAVFNYEDPKGNKEARSHVYKLRQTKSAVDAARKKEKQASLEYGRRVDSEAKEIMAEIESMIEVHAKPLAEIEQREEERKERHRDRIEGIQTAANQTEGPDGQALTAADYQRALEYVEGIEIGDSWEEFVMEAAAAKDSALATLRRRLADRQQYEAEQAELERLRKEAAEREQRDRDERIRREAEERARREAEDKARAEREAAERRERELQEEAERERRERIEAQERADRAEQEARERAEQEAAEARRQEQEEAARRERDRKHKAAIHSAALQGFVEGGMSERQAKMAVSLIAKGKVPRVSISY